MTLKAVQMDLARQKETLEQIFEFFELASCYKYNAVVLYLENRIKTKTYHYDSDEESYTPDEIRCMVKYASKLGLDLIPVVSNFFHTDGFFKHEELRHLAELRNGDAGFFSDEGAPLYMSACPLLPESQNFFDSYYAEVASLFPSKYFIAGLDEDYDIGSCELCKARVENDGGIGPLFLEHVIRTNNVLKSLGKEMIMFDDMFWFCPEVLPDVPKDIILCTWCYDYINRYPRCSMGNNMQADIFNKYEKLGIRYMPAGWTNFSYNVDTFTKYAENYSPFGYLNTTWGMTAELMHFTYPLIAYTGMLWNGELKDAPLERMKKAVEEVCGLSDASEIAIVAQAVTKPYLLRAPTYYYHDVIVRRNVNFDDEYKDIAYNYELLKRIESDNEIIRQVKYRARRAMLLYEQLVVAQNVFDMRTGAAHTDLELCKKKLHSIREELLGLFDEQYNAWEKYRGGIPTTYLDTEKATLISSVDKLIEIAETAEFGKNGFLDIVLLLPDKVVCRWFDVTVKYEDGETVFAEGMYKPLLCPCYTIMDKGPFWYTVSFAIDSTKKIESCTISTHGVGAVHIEYISAFAKGTKYLPEKVIPICGHVENPDHLLSFDTRWCTIGHDDTIELMNNRAKAKSKSTVKINLKKDC